MPPALPIEGGCRCARVRFRIDAPPMITMACHCCGCRQMSGSAFSLNVAVPSAALTVVAGETVIGGLHGAQIRHHHCDHCKSWLFTRIEPDPGFANVRVGALDDPGAVPPASTIWTAAAPGWACIDPALPALDGQPPAPPPAA